MALAIVKSINDREAAQHRTRVAIEAYNVRSSVRISPWPIPVCSGPFLDVDGILQRSLPRTFRSRLRTASGKESLLRVKATRFRPWRSMELTLTPAKRSK